MNSLQDDIILEVVNLCGAMSLDPECAPLISGSRIIKVLHELLQEKHDDDEIQLQLLYVFHQLLRYPETLDELLYDTGILPDVMELAGANNPEVRNST